MKYKFNVRPEDCRYIVNEDKRKVICLIENTENMFIAFANNNLEIPCDCYNTVWTPVKNSSKHFYRKLRMPKRFWGIATCAENDEWDVEKGKLLAFSKAKDKLNTSFFKRANFYINTLDRSLNRATTLLNNFGNKLTASSIHRHEKLAEMLGENENGVSEN